MFKFIREFDNKQTVTIEVENDSLTIWEVKNMFIDFLRGCGYSDELIKREIGEYSDL